MILDAGVNLMLRDHGHSAMDGLKPNNSEKRALQGGDVSWTSEVALVWGLNASARAANLESKKMG